MMFSSKKALFISALITLSLFVAKAEASSILYQPQNPAIFADAPPGGNAQLLASTQRPSDPKAASYGGGLTDAEILKQSILAQSSSAINNEIFNSMSPTGTFPLGDGSTVSYVRNGTMVTITFTAADGTSTVITVPGHI